MEGGISIKDGVLVVPDRITVPVIIGDGIGTDITPTAMRVIDAAVKKAYDAEKSITWKEILAGEAANKKVDSWLPQETLDAIKNYKVALKGPLTTPVGEGIRSLNVTLRQELDLYACVRPVRHFAGVPSPVKKPDEVDVVIFRENTEDVYAGIEWAQGSQESQKIIDTVKALGKKIPDAAGIGIKPISEEGTKRLVRAAIKYAIARGRKSVTLVHKGNIMKYTEGAFRNWGYEIAKAEFSDNVISEQEIWDGASPDGKIIIKDRIADSIFQQLLLRPSEYDVLATMNLNGDYLSDAAAAQVGGIGIAPGANINYVTGVALFEATHGTAPKYTDMDKANPSSVLLSGVMMLEYLGWQDAADLVIDALEKTISSKVVTYDFARLMDGATEVSCSKFGDEIIKNMR